MKRETSYPDNQKERVMTTGRVIAIAGIWIGVGLASFGMGVPAVFVACVALLATAAVANA